MGLAYHKRYFIVEKAGHDIRDSIWDLMKKHDLTYGEIMKILATEQQNIAKYMIREERHPGDPDKKGDEA